MDRARITRVDLSDTGNKELSKEIFSTRLSQAVVNLNKADGFIVITIHKNTRSTTVVSCLEDNILAPAMVALNTSLMTVMAEARKTYNVDIMQAVTQAMAKMMKQTKKEIDKSDGKSDG